MITWSGNCYYCGDEITEKSKSTDHIKPKSNGGSNRPRNLVICCNVCNGIKGNRTIKEMRYRLIQKKIRWPKFTHEQLDWLRNRGFDMTEFDTAKLAFER